MTIARHVDWEERLNDWIADHQQFDWPVAEFPCGHLATGVGEAVTGSKVFGSTFAYKSPAGAGRLLKKYGDLEGAVDSALTPLEAPGLAQRGDIILTEDGNLAVCFGKFAYGAGDLPDGSPGLIRHLMHEWKKAWRLG